MVGLSINFFGCIPSLAKKHCLKLQPVATCCLFLAGKAEETPKKCRDIIRTMRQLTNDRQFETFGVDPREEIMALERVLLQVRSILHSPRPGNVQPKSEGGRITYWFDLTGFTFRNQLHLCVSHFFHFSGQADFGLSKFCKSILVLQPSPGLDWPIILFSL